MCRTKRAIAQHVYFTSDFITTYTCNEYVLDQTRNCAVCSFYTFRMIFLTPLWHEQHNCSIWNHHRLFCNSWVWWHQPAKLLARLPKHTCRKVCVVLLSIFIHSSSCLGAAKLLLSHLIFSWLVWWKDQWLALWGQWENRLKWLLVASRWRNCGEEREDQDDRAN